MYFFHDIIIVCLFVRAFKQLQVSSGRVAGWGRVRQRVWLRAERRRCYRIHDCRFVNSLPSAWHVTSQSAARL